MSHIHIEIQVGGYEIHQGDDHPCSHPEQLWLFNAAGEGLEVRVKALEEVLDKFFKENF